MGETQRKLVMKLGLTKMDVISAFVDLWGLCAPNNSVASIDTGKTMKMMLKLMSLSTANQEHLWTRVETNLAKTMKMLKGCQETRGFQEMDATCARVKAMAFQLVQRWDVGR